MAPVAGTGGAGGASSVGGAGAGAAGAAAAGAGAGAGAADWGAGEIAGAIGVLVGIGAEPGPGITLEGELGNWPDTLGRVLLGTLTGDCPTAIGALGRGETLAGARGAWLAG